MQEQLENEDEISLSDIFHAVLAKLWMIVIALLVGAIVGASYGFVKYHDVHYYGGSVRYYISSATSTSDSETATTGLNAQAYKESVFKCIISVLDDSETFFQSQLYPRLSESEEETPEPYTSEYYSLFKKYCNSVSYSYTVSDGTLNNVLTVSVSILNNEKLAKDMLVAITDVLPEYLVQFMTNDVFGTTQCQQLDNLQCNTSLLNDGQTKRQMIKYGALVGLVAAVAVCLIIILIDRMDTRLRNVDVVTQKFDLPVLGVIPRIETNIEQSDPTDPNNTKNSSNTKTTENKKAGATK